MFAFGKQHRLKPRTFWPAFLISLAMGAWGAAAQDQPPVPAGATPPVATPPTAMPAPLSVLENTGRPMLATFQCTDEDIQRAGLTCSEEDPCPVYLELATVDAAGSRILAAGNLHTSAVTLYSLLLASEDGGRTWREIHERIRSAGLDRIQFLDAETGWVAGEKLSPLPQDPFLLLTTDGGKTWREATLEEPVMDKCLTRFRYNWNWAGGPANIASRAVDSTGYVQPTVQDIAKSRAIVGFVQHHNGVFPWSISESGEVKNAIA